MEGEGEVGVFVGGGGVSCERKNEGDGARSEGEKERPKLTRPEMCEMFVPQVVDWPRCRSERK